MRELPVKVSIIIPVYNVENYLSVCLNSCVHQTLHDIEIICVNDGSTDNSLKILREFAEHDYRIKIIDKPNGGVSSARNAGLQVARGRYIMFLDSDDYLQYNACEYVWSETLNAPTDIIIFSSSIFPDNPKPVPWYYSVINAPNCRYWEFSPKVLFGEKSTTPFLWHQAFRKELLDEYNIKFDEKVKIGEDMVFLMQTYPHAKNFCFMGEKLYNYRWYHEGSLMWNFKGDMDTRIIKHMEFVEIICQYWENNGWLELYGLEFLEWMLEFIVGDIRDKNVKCSAKHIEAMNVLIRKYGLEGYLGKVSFKSKVYVKNLKRGYV